MKINKGILNMCDDILYSCSEDEWFYADGDIELVARQFLDDMSDIERMATKVITLYKGVPRPRYFVDFLRVEDVLESMRERALEEGEHAEGFLCDISDSQKKDLENAIVSWASRHNISPSWSVVESVEEVKFTVPEDWD